MPPLAWGVAVQDHAHAAFVAGGRLGLGASRQAAPPAHTCGSARIRRVAATMALTSVQAPPTLIVAASAGA
jgi:hypothetical protein